MAWRLTRVACGSVVLLLARAVPLPAQAVTAPVTDIWVARDVKIARADVVTPVRVAIWDSGIDTTLFVTQLARDLHGQVVLRGYDAHKRRQDTPMEVLPPALEARRDELNAALQAYDDVESGRRTEESSAIAARRRALSVADRQAFDDAIERWSGYVHGTGVADIALAGHEGAEIVIARMEWWHGSPPVPCWSRELAVREAESIGDLLAFLVANGARVVNMSWGRAERSYLGNLSRCARSMPEERRRALARFTVDTIRAVLRRGMAAAPQVLFVGAAGNEGTSVEVANPATRFSLPNFLLVGAVDRTGARARYTNTGPEVTLYANGERVESRLPGGAVSFPSGTSMATPNVSNAAAKMLAVNPGLSGAELRELLERTGDMNLTGQRLLHPARAVDAARAARAAR